MHTRLWVQRAPGIPHALVFGREIHAQSGRVAPREWRVVSEPCQRQAQRIVIAQGRQARFARSGASEHFEFTFYLFSSALHNILHAKLPLTHTRSEWKDSAEVFGNVTQPAAVASPPSDTPNFECISSFYTT
jgi:hypothetical protein